VLIYIYNLTNKYGILYLWFVDALFRRRLRGRDERTVGFFQGNIISITAMTRVTSITITDVINISITNVTMFTFLLSLLNRFGFMLRFINDHISVRVSMAGSVAGGAAGGETGGVARCEAGGVGGGGPFSTL
jgi:hypothetical protein